MSLQNKSDQDFDLTSLTFAQHQLNEAKFTESFQQWSLNDAFVNRPSLEQPSFNFSATLTDEVVKKHGRDNNLKGTVHCRNSTDSNELSEKYANNGFLLSSPVKFNLVSNDWKSDERPQSQGLSRSPKRQKPNQRDNNVTQRGRGLINSPSKKRKLRSDRTSPDRYIPRTLHTDAAHCLQKGESSNASNREKGSIIYDIETEIARPPQLNNFTFYQNKIAKACGINLKTRILQFKPPPPKANLAAGAKAYSSLYDYEPSAWRRGYATDGGVSASCRRKICTTPIRVLDAPGMIDDFYRNLMAWSCKNVVALCLEDSVYLWNATTGKITCLIEQAPYSISSISWSEDATNLAIGMDDGIMEIWDTEVQKKVRTMRLTTNTAVGALTWNSYLLTSGSRHPSIWNHDVRIANHRVMEYRGHLAGVCGLEWKQDGTQLASGGNDNLLNIWDIRSSVAKFTKTTHKSAVKALAWCPWKPNLLASGGGCSDRQVHFWNTTTGTRLKTLDAGSQVTSLKWSIDYKEIVSTHGFPNNNIVVWNYPDLTKLVDITAHESRILHCALSPDGSTLATTAADENLKFWKLFMKNEKQKVEPMNQGGSIAKVVTIR